MWMLVLSKHYYLPVVSQTPREVPICDVQLCGKHNCECGRCVNTTNSDAVHMGSGVIGMSVARVDVVVCVNCGNRKVVGDDIPYRNLELMVPAETTDRRR
jgi:hypothetical protein